jgi:hypothetical protein
LRGGIEAEVGLTAADQFEVNLGEDFGVEQSAVLFSGGVVDTEAAAERVERGGGAGEFLPRDQQGIGGAAHGDLWQADGAEFVVEELHIESGIVDHQLRVADEIEEGLAYVFENRVVSQEIVAEAMDLEGGGGHGAHRVYVLVIGLAGGQVVEKLDRADFDDAVAFAGFKAGGFGVEDDLTHFGLGYGRSGL